MSRKCVIDKLSELNDNILSIVYDDRIRKKFGNNLYDQEHNGRIADEILDEDYQVLAIKDDMQGTAG